MNYTKPTKFELMRQGRERADFAAIPRPFVDLSAPLPPYVDLGSLVPTMEVDGVKYREAPERDAEETCNGCAFLRSRVGTCFGERGICEVAKQSFGGSCIDRHVIYIRAE